MSSTYNKFNDPDSTLASPNFKTGCAFYPVFSSRLGHCVHVCVAALIALYLTAMISTHPPPTAVFEQAGLLQSHCEKIHLSSCADVFYIQPLTSLCYAAYLLFARKAAWEFATSENFDAQSRDKVLDDLNDILRSGAVFFTCISLSWCAFLCLSLGLEAGFTLYIQFFMPHQFTMGQATACRAAEKLYENYCKDRVDLFCGELEYSIVREHDQSLPEFFINVIDKYDALYNTLETMYAKILMLRYFDYVLTSCAAVGLLLVGLVSKSWAMSMGCVTTVTIVIIVFLKEMWNSAEITEICQGKNKDSIPRLALAHGKKAMGMDASLAYSRFLQHFAMMPTGATGPVMGIITKKKLLMAMKAVVSASPVVIGFKRLVIESVS